MVTAVCGALLAAAAATASAAPPPLDTFLREGQLREGIEAYTSPTDNAGRFSLAVLEIVEGARQFGVGLTGLALHPDFRNGQFPFLRLAGSDRTADATRKATPAEVAALFHDLRAAAQRANAAAASVDAAEFKVEINLLQARMDLNGDGKVDPNETVMETLGGPLGMTGAMGGETTGLVVRFDNADAVWLTGYTHVIMGMLDLVTAYDWMPVWNQCAHRVFQNPDPMPAFAKFAAAGSAPSEFGLDFRQIADVIVTVHDWRLQPAAPERLLSARGHFLAMVQCSRKCWDLVLAETDDDHEWLPSPSQAGPFGARITAEQIAGWRAVLDEVEAVLTGKRLLPHWRMKEGTGININKLVKSPPPFDLVLWVHGSAFTPYAEEGPVSSQARWRELTGPFGPGFVGFALWSN